MNTKVLLSGLLLAFGVIVLVVLVALGGVVKKRLDDTIMSRLEYDIPDGYKDDPNFEECYRATKAMFDEEYYIWNLTNKDDVLNGGVGHFDLLGPFSYTQWYCNYDHSINEETGYLTYRTFSEGYMFLRGDSSDDDSVLVTNVNPAYLGLMEKLGYNDQLIPVLMSGAALETIITTIAGSSTQISISAIPTILAPMNAQIYQGVHTQAWVKYWSQLTQAQIPAFYTNGFYLTGTDSPGWTTYVTNNYPGANTSISTDAQTAIFNVLTNLTTLSAFAATDVATISANYGVTASQAGLLLYYVRDIIVSPDGVNGGITNQPGFNQAIKATIYSQWANFDQSNSSYIASSGLSGWELVPNSASASHIAAADVAALFNNTGPCSLTNKAGYQIWLAKLTSFTTVDISVACPNVFVGLQSNPQQQLLVVSWLASYGTKVAGPLLLANFGLSNWNDFAYAQWGGLILGQSVGTGFSPEIAAYNATGAPYVAHPETCSRYSLTAAKSLLEGSTPLFDSTNMVEFFTLVQGGAAQIPTILSIWPAFNDSDHIFCFAYYLQTVIQPNAIQPLITAARQQGGDLFTTRSVREWFFTAEDPLLELLQQSPSVAFVGNTTYNKTVGDSRNFTYVRVYTGHNDLHWSLMPANEGDPLPFWQGDVRITGYNGSQFLPNGYLDDKNKKYPLELFNAKINRTIPFKNVGKDEWDDVHVRYLTLSDDSLLSAAKNPANEPYYAYYSGVINKTSNPPYLPLYLTTPNFNSAEDSFKQNVVLTDSIWNKTYDPTDKFSRHRLSLFVLAEPTLGTSLWGNLPIQINLQYRATALYPNVRTAYAPIYWNAIGDIATKHDLDQVKSVLYVGQTAWKVLIGVGVGVGVSIIIAGIVLVHHFVKHENELKDATSSTS